MNKQKITKEKGKRILASALSLAMLLTAIPIFTMNAGAAEDAQKERVADENTVGTYEDFLDLVTDSFNAGRIWTDKSVYALDGGFDEILGVNVGDMTSGADFLEVFSALGSSMVVNGAEDVPLDVMFVLDMSGSMCELTADGDTRLAKAVDALNDAFDYVLTQNKYNRVGLYVFSGDDYSSAFYNWFLGREGTDAGDGMGVLSLGRYTAKKDENGGNGDYQYFSVGSEPDPLSEYTPSGEPQGDQVYMKVNVAEATMLSDEPTVYDSRVWWYDGDTDKRLGAVYYTADQLVFYNKDEGYFVIGGDDIEHIRLYEIGDGVYDSEEPSDDALVFYTKDTWKDEKGFELEDKIRAVGATNTQTGLYTAMEAMAEEEATTVYVKGKEVTRRPVVILLTDGLPTISDRDPDWWEPGDGCGYQGTGRSDPFYYGNGMLAMATASYMKREINRNYYDDPDPVGENSALVFTFGIDITDDEKTIGNEEEIAKAILNPKETFASDTANSVAKDIMAAWEAYQKYDEVTVTVNEKDADWQYYDDYDGIIEGYTTHSGWSAVYTSKEHEQVYNFRGEEGIKDENFVVPGEVFSYNIEWKNKTADAAAVTVTDQLGDGVVFVSATPAPDGDGYDRENNKLTWTIADAAAGAEGIIEVTVQVRDPYPDNDNYIVKNDAYYQFGSEDYIFYSVHPRLETLTEESDEKIKPSDDVTFAINWKEDVEAYHAGGLEALNGTTLTVTSYLDEGVIFKGATGNYRYDKHARTVTWTVDENTDYDTLELTVEATEYSIRYINTDAVSVRIGDKDYGGPGIVRFVKDYHQFGLYAKAAGTPYYNQAPIPGVNGSYAGEYTFTHPESAENEITTLVYNDEYRNVSSAELSEMLEEVLEGIHNTVPLPIEGSNDLTREDGMLSYYDPIGEYMEVKVNDGLLGKLSLFGATYDVVRYSDGSYHVVDGGKADAEIVNPSYKDSVVTFNLNEIAVRVDSTTDAGLRHEVLRVDIPAAALPVWTVDYDFDASPSYNSNNDVLPLRLFYTVGMQDYYLIKDGSDGEYPIDLSKISAEYKEMHRDPATGRVYFYSNDYSSSPYIYNSNGEVSERGDAYTTFSPADSNYFYIYQACMPLYTDPDEKDTDETDRKSHVTSYDEFKDAGEYYFDYKYYTPDGVETEQLLCTGAWFGTVVPANSNLVWYDLITERCEPFTADKPAANQGEAGKWVVATKEVGLRVGDMSGHSEDGLKGEDDNNTGTSGTYYLPTVSGNTVEDNVIITNFLGNNGVRSADDVTLLITKQVESDKEGWEDEVFAFTVNIPSMANRTNVSAVMYELYSDGTDEYWLRAARTEVQVSDGYLVNTDGTLSDIKVGDSRVVTVSRDGKTGTVTREDGKKEVVYTVDFINGVAAYTYNFKVDLQPYPYLYPISFDKDGSAEIWLTHGQGVMLHGLDTGKLSVTETFTEEQLEADYYVKKVLDENGKARTVKADADNDSHTVEAELKSTLNINAPAHSELHWFNKTGRFGKDETQVNGKDVETAPDEKDDKLLHGPVLTVGDKITYEISWVNDAEDEKGRPVASTVTITDKLDAGVEFVEADNDGVYDSDDHTVTWTIGADAKKSGTVTLTVKVTKDALKKSKVENRAQIVVENGSKITTNVVDNPVEGKTETAPGEGVAVMPGDVISYEIKWTNDAKNAEGKPTEATVTITDKLDNGVEFVSAGSDGKYDQKTHTVTWSFTAEANTQGKVTLTVKVTEEALEEGKVENGAKISVDNGSTVDTNAVENPVKVPVIEIVKTQAVNGGEATTEELTVQAGDTVTYYLTVTNTGKETAKDVVVTDKIPVGTPDGVKLKQGAISNGSLLDDGETVKWTIKELEPGEDNAVTVSFTVIVPEVKKDTTWVNFATVSFANNPKNHPEDPDSPADPNDPHKGRETEDSNDVVIKEGTPKLKIEKTQSVGEVTAEYLVVNGGDEVKYSITVTNIGTAAAKDVVVTDKIPDGDPADGVLKLSSIDSNGARLGKTNTIVWKIDEIKPGKENAVTVSFTVIVPEVYEDTTWKNTATVSFGNNPDNPPEDPDNPTEPDPKNPHKGRKPENSDEVVIEEFAAKLKIEKSQSVNGGEPTDAKLIVKPGDTVTYYLTVTNTGTAAAEGVAVTDVIPDGLTLKRINDGGGLLSDDKTIAWEIDKIEVDEAVTVSFTVTVPTVEEDAEWTNIATLSFANNPKNPSEDPDNPTEPDPDDPHKDRETEDSNDVVIEEKVPVLSIEKSQSVNGGDQTDAKLTVKPGDTVTYYLTVTNTGTATAEGVAVTDVIPDGLTLKKINDGGGLLSDDKTIAWEIDKIEVDKAVTVSFTVTVPAVEEDTVWTNIAVLSFANNPKNPPEDPDNPTEPDPEDPHKDRETEDSNEVEIEEFPEPSIPIIPSIPGIPRLSIEKTQSVNGGAQTTEKQTVESGDAVTYYITVENTGTATARDVVITDEIPEGLTLATIGSGGKKLVDGKTIMWEIGDLRIGAAVTVSFTVNVPEVDEDTVWKNIATVSYENNRENPDDPAEPDPNDPHKGRKPKASNKVEIEEKPAPAPVPDDENYLDLDDDGLPRGDQNLNDPNNLPTGVVLSIGSFAAAGISFASAVALNAAGKAGKGRKKKKH